MNDTEEYLFKHEFCSEDLKCVFTREIDRYGNAYTELTAVYLKGVDIQGLLSDDVEKRIYQSFEDYLKSLEDFYA
jgi:hypothetical protein